MKNYQVYFQIIIMNQNYIQINIKEIIINKIKNNNNYQLIIEKIYLNQLNKMKAKLVIQIIILNKIKTNNYNINYKKKELLKIQRIVQMEC